MNATAFKQKKDCAISEGLMSNVIRIEKKALKSGFFVLIVK